MIWSVRFCDLFIECALAAMDLYALECVACGAVQPRATCIDQDPKLFYCCPVLDHIICSTLKSQDNKLRLDGRCFMCASGACGVGESGVFCNRQSCLLLMALRSTHDVNVFRIRACSWSQRDALCTNWASECLDDTRTPQQQLPAKARIYLEELAFGL